MKGINLELTRWQTLMLKPLFDVAQEADAAGKPTIILAQVWEHGAKGEPGFMDIRVLPYDACAAVQSAVGTKPGRLPDGNRVRVTCPIESDGTQGG